jgi:asparagine synthase (glutamine-hydrolysing)
MRAAAGGSGPADQLASVPAGVAEFSDSIFAVGMVSRPMSPEEAAAPGLLVRHGLVLAARCRLDNRDEVAKLLASPLPPGCSDAELVLELYRKRGVAALDSLCGDWALALWDPARRRLLLARDATGISAMFWWQGGGQLVFATSLRTLVAAPQVPRRPCARRMAGLLAVFPDPERPCATAFEEVQGIPPGQLLLAEDGRLEARAWWQPERLPLLGCQALPELEQQFLGLYEQAVRQRLRRAGGTVAATASGGLDSGSLIALAAPALGTQGLALTGYVHVPRFQVRDAPPNRTLDEWPLALAMARHVGNVDLVPCKTEQMSPVQALRVWLDLMVVPSHAASNWYWILDVAQRARADGAQVLLSGRGGNATVSYTGTGNLWPRLAQGRLWHTLQELRSEAAGPWAALTARLIKPALRPIRHRWQELRAHRDVGAGWRGHGLLNQTLARSVGLEDAMSRASYWPASAHRPAWSVADWRLGRNGGASNPTTVHAQLGDALGLSYRDPTADRRLVEFCWRLPDELYWSHGLQRGLVRHAMKRYLPPEILSSRRKGLQSADLRERLQACGGDLMDEVGRVTRHPLVREWVDVPRLVQSAEAALVPQVPPHPTHDVVAPSHVLRALAAAMFIAKYA